MDQDPLRVAIVGSGPAGFYAAEHILATPDLSAAVDMFDRLPTPFGLVRSGVAPDHPKLKSVIRIYEKTAARDEFRFFGGVEVGVDVTHQELAERYDAVIYAVGAQSDRQMGIPGEDLPGSHPATAFVGWYNAHPDFCEHEFDLSCERAVVIGNGNVAMDVARMLALPRAELETTDVADHAVEALAGSGIREIVVVGRRGPAQAAFTNPELRELGELTDADVIVETGDIALDAASAAWLETAHATHRKNMTTLEDFAGREPSGRPKRVILRFTSSPVEIHGDRAVEAITLERNELVDDGTGALRAVPTGETERIETGLVLRSIGYRGVPLAGVPFDEDSAVIPNELGRVIDPETGDPLAGTYAVGWIKRGPSGIIGTNKKDARETVDALLEDLASSRLPKAPDRDPESIERLLDERVPSHVTYEGWQAIDAVERERGEPRGRPRVKITSVDEMLDVARGAGRALTS